MFLYFSDKFKKMIFNLRLSTIAFKTTVSCIAIFHPH